MGFYQDVFYGGVTSGGFSTGQGAGSGTLNLFIEPGSSIKKAYLFTYRIGYPPNVPITINGAPFLFDTINVIMQVSHGSPFVGATNLYYYDFTNDLSSNITSAFNITIPNQFGLPINWGYWTIYLYIAYENPVLPKVATSLWVNDKDFMGNESYVFTNMNPINNSFPVGLSLFLDRACDNTTDGTIVTLNSNNIGTIGGPDAVNNLWNCSGSKGHFYYQNNTLFGLDDDTPDNLMNSTDALADMSSYVLNNVTNYNLDLLYMNPLNPPAGYNLNNLFINAYSTPCDTFTTNATTNQDTICLGESAQLNASGGATYSWYSAFSTFNDSTTPIQTTTYIVTIKNDSGCVKTEHVKICVNPLPMPNSLTTNAAFCSDSTGSLKVDTINSNSAPYNYSLINLQTSDTLNQTQNTFYNLGAGNYLLQITDANGCFVTDTILINDVQVDCPIDTIEITFVIPNVFTPNFDGDNDNFVIQLTGSSLIKELKVEIFNRWGMLVAGSRFDVQSLENILTTNNQQQLTIWDGRTNAAEIAPEGTYFYVVTYTTLKDEVKSEKGSISLLK